MKTLLIVDDAPFVRRFLQKGFSKYQLNMLTAKSGQEAIEIVKKQQVDLLVTDLWMEEGTGFDLLSALKEPLPKSIVVLSSDFQEETRDKLDDLPFECNFVNKPLDAGQFKKIVDFLQIEVGE